VQEVWAFQIAADEAENAPAAGQAGRLLVLFALGQAIEANEDGEGPKQGNGPGEAADPAGEVWIGEVADAQDEEIEDGDRHHARCNASGLEKQGSAADEHNLDEEAVKAHGLLTGGGIGLFLDYSLKLEIGEIGRGGDEM